MCNEIDAIMELNAALALLRAAERGSVEHDEPGLRVGWWLHHSDMQALAIQARQRIEDIERDGDVFWPELQAGDVIRLTADRSHLHPALKLGRRLEVRHTPTPGDCGATFRVYDYPSPDDCATLWFPLVYVQGYARACKPTLAPVITAR